MDLKLYADSQPSGFKNHIQNVTIVGASGQIGSHITRELLRSTNFRVSALTRPESKSEYPDNVVVKTVNYNKPSTVVEALRGEDVLIITLAGNAPEDQEQKLIDAAAEANVAWVVPNEWGLDSDDASLAADSVLGAMKQKTRRHIEKLGKSCWISLVCGFWYGFSLTGGPERFGFDFPSRTVTFYDDGSTKINTSTLEQCGLALSRALSLKILPDSAQDQSPTLTQFKNKPVYVSSFLVSQRDMFESVLRATGQTKEDWTARHQDVKERYKEGTDQMESGDMLGLVKLLYARDFYPNGGGNYGQVRGLHNALLGLPVEDLDKQTKDSLEEAGM